MYFPFRAELLSIKLWIFSRAFFGGLQFPDAARLQCFFTNSRTRLRNLARLRSFGAAALPTSFNLCNFSSSNLSLRGVFRNGTALRGSKPSSSNVRRSFSSAFKKHGIHWKFLAYRTCEYNWVIVRVWSCRLLISFVSSRQLTWYIPADVIHTSCFPYEIADAVRLTLIFLSSPSERSYILIVGIIFARYNLSLIAVYIECWVSFKQLLHTLLMLV